MKVILCGYHWTGCNALEWLISKKYELFVYTHNTNNSIADLEGYCIKMNIPYSLDKISINNIPFVPDVICSVYYRYIISEDIIKMVKGKIFNLHPSLLPKYRGCSSLTWAMINGEVECGYTFHYIDSGCDTGDIILQKSIEIYEYDTQLTLYNRVMFEAMQSFPIAFKMVIEGYAGRKQIGSESYYKRGCPFEGKIIDEMEEKMKERFIRAMIYPPYPSAKYKGKEIKTYKEYRDCLKNENKY